MPRYFIEFAYKGTHYSGLQIQDKGITVQGELNKALEVLTKSVIVTTSSSRTDAGVHARQNYLHIDLETEINPRLLYGLNAILPSDIVVNSITQVNEQAHARFDALSRQYHYNIIQKKDVFNRELAYFYPFKLDVELMNQAAAVLLKTMDFTSFAKRHSDVNNFNCHLTLAVWSIDSNGLLVFQVTANRFLRGMVRTQLLVGRKKINLSEFSAIIEERNCSRADFSTPAHGLFLNHIEYPASVFENVNQ